MDDIHILAIESSCDDTSAAVFCNGKVLANLVANQEIHQSYGGVVPELASRAHMQNIIPVVSQALKIAGISKSQLNAIAYTKGPGLIGSLLVGATFAKTLAVGLKVPTIAVNHMRAHILAHFIDEPKPQFPFLCLTVSGGHTQIVLVRHFLDMEVVGHTIDDAAGEAFDKTAKIIGLPYPGGPLIDKYARQGNPKAYKFTEPKVTGLNFSYSGFKTAVLYFIQKRVAENSRFVDENLNDICASIQYTIVNSLINKVKKAATQYNIKQVAIAGGVSANSGLRETLQQTGEELGWQTFVPQLEYCTDNAAMIGITAYYKYLNHDFAPLDDMPMARLKL